MMTDLQALSALMMRARDGDGPAMGQLLVELTPKLRSYIRRQLVRCGQTDPADTEDLLQITLLAIYTKQHTYDPTLSLIGWVYTIARYKVVDHLRSSQRRRADVPLEEAEELMATDDHVAAEANWDLSAVLEHLPARTRALIEATKIEGVGMAEAADRAGMSEAAGKVAVHRGLKRLAELFGRSRPL